jgi:nitrite reductase/ring-hydroxylating ferredoxin subunit
MKKLTQYILSTVLAITLIFVLARCGKSNNGQQNDVPSVPVNITVNMNLPEYLILQSQGGWAYLNGGVKGIVLYHHYDDNFYAMERNCPYQPFDSCAIVTVENNDVFLRCGQYKSDTDTTWIPCCNSQYSLEAGFLISGPSQYSLTNYRVGRSGNILVVSN